MRLEHTVNKNYLTRHFYHELPFLVEYDEDLRITDFHVLFVNDEAVGSIRRAQQDGLPDVLCCITYNPGTTAWKVLHHPPYLSVEMLGLLDNPIHAPGPFNGMQLTESVVHEVRTAFFAKLTCERKIRLEKEDADEKKRLASAAEVAEAAAAATAATAQAVAAAVAEAARIQASADECSICMTIPSQGCCIPCGHYCLCIVCAEKLMEDSSARCPFCRIPLQRFQRVYNKN